MDRLLWGIEFTKAFHIEIVFDGANLKWLDLMHIQQMRPQVMVR